jgi:radical SAM superfamily enzyme YgiQ (UPF0313 family)
MKICLISPAFPNSLWSFRGMSSVVNKKGGFAPIGIATIAACTPSHHQVQLIDEEIEPIPEHIDAEIIAISAYNVQSSRAFDLARRFRSQGKLVVMGGSYASLCPEKCQPHVDVVFVGEGERIWPQFLSEYEQRNHKNYYEQVEKLSLLESPIPSFDKLPYREYMEFTIQTTRGCPFTCEFCDIIITDGRTPRSKSVEQVIRELESLCKLGAVSALFTDANFFGNPRYTKQLLVAMAEFGKRYHYPMHFACEATINIAEKEEILLLMREANFTRIFVGIESPNSDSLIETKKQVNTRRPLLESIWRLQSHGLDVAAGMIVGFDSDTKDIFQKQFDFLKEAGITLTTVGTLVALERTPLHARLQESGRLLGVDLQEGQGHGASDTNFTPLQMTLEELRHGHNWLIRSLFSYKNHSERMLTFAKRFATSNDSLHPPPFSMEVLVLLKNLLSYYLLTRDGKRRDYFLSTIKRALPLIGSLQSKRAQGALIALMSQLLVHKHVHGFVTEMHGDPETIPSKLTFQSTARERQFQA